jgi:hypothetical protein
MRFSLLPVFGLRITLEDREEGGGQQAGIAETASEVSTKTDLLCPSSLLPTSVLFQVFLLGTALNSQREFSLLLCEPRW